MALHRLSGADFGKIRDTTSSPASDGYALVFPPGTLVELQVIFEVSVAARLQQ